MFHESKCAIFLEECQFIFMKKIKYTVLTSYMYVIQILVEQS